MFWLLYNKVYLLLQCIEQLAECLVGIACVTKQSDELAAYDGTGGIVMRTFERLTVAYAEAYHARIVQIHGIDTLEVLLLGFVEILLRTGYACRTYHIDESVGVTVDKSDALFRCLWRYHHDATQIVAVGKRLYLAEIVIEGQVGDDESRDSALHTTLAEASYP